MNQLKSTTLYLLISFSLLTACRETKTENTPPLERSSATFDSLNFKAKTADTIKVPPSIRSFVKLNEMDCDSIFGQQKDAVTMKHEEYYFHKIIKDCDHQLLFTLIYFDLIKRPTIRLYSYNKNELTCEEVGILSRINTKGPDVFSIFKEDSIILFNYDNSLIAFFDDKSISDIEYFCDLYDQSTTTFHLAQDCSLDKNQGSKSTIAYKVIFGSEEVDSDLIEALNVKWKNILPQPYDTALIKRLREDVLIDSN